MAVTYFSLLIAVSMITLVVSLFMGTLGGKNSQLLVPSLVSFLVVVPIIFGIIFWVASAPYAVVGIFYDWISSYPISPISAIFVGSTTGGFLGIKAGTIWLEDNDRSCMQCMLVPISLLVLASLVVLLLP
jgi:hypothetical protein